MVNQDTGVTLQQFDAPGNLVQRMDSQGRLSRYHYDDAKRLVERTDEDGITQWTWDEKSGNLLQITDAHSSESFAYNGSSLLESHIRSIDGHRFETQYRYDVRERLSSTVLPDGQVLNRHYHESGSNRGELSSISRETWGGLSQETLISEIDTDWRDGESGYVASSGLSTRHEFTNAGQIRSISTDQLLELNYQFDEEGHIVEIDENGFRESYQYDNGRLVLFPCLSCEISPE